MRTTPVLLAILVATSAAVAMPVSASMPASPAARRRREPR